MPSPRTLYLRAKRRGSQLYEYLLVDPATNLVESVLPDDIPTTADIKDVAVDVFDALQTGVITVADALAGLAVDIGVGLANATLEVIEFAGPRLVDGIDNTYDYIRAKIRGYEPDVITAVTVGLLAVLGGIYLWNAAKRGTMTYSE